MRHIRLAEIRCFDRKVFSLTFAFLHIYYALQLWQHVLQKRPQQLASKKLLKLHKVTVFWYFENSQSFGMLRHAYCLTLKM